MSRATHSWLHLHRLLSIPHGPLPSIPRDPLPSLGKLHPAEDPSSHPSAYSSSPLSVLEQLTHSTTQVQKTPHHQAQPPPCRGCPGDRPLLSPGSHSLTLSFWKEWRKLPPSSPSSLGVPGGLLMPLMLFGEFCGRWGKEVVSRSLWPPKRPGGRTQPRLPQSHPPDVSPSIRVTSSPQGQEKGGTTHPLCISLTFGSPSMSPDPAEGGAQKENRLIEHTVMAPAPTCPATPPTQRLCSDHWSELGADPRTGAGTGMLCQHPQGAKAPRAAAPLRGRSPNDPFM